MWTEGDALRRRTLALVWVLALLAIVACSSKKPQTQPTPGASLLVSPGASGSPSGGLGSSPTATTSPKPAAKTARKVVYTRANDLWLYTVATNSVRRLTSTAQREYDPKFIDADRITFLTFSDPVTSIYEMRLSTRSLRLLFRSSAVGQILVHSWSPGHTTIAYITTDRNAAKHDLRFFVASSRSDRRIRQFGAFEGREFIDDDSISVAWAPDGRSVLVVMTPLEKGPSMYVVRATGANVISGHEGTFARWARDGKHVYFREFSGKKRWYMISVPGDVGTLMRANAGTYRPALSPDGTTWVFDDGAAKPSIYAYTIATKAQRRVGAGLDALYLSDATLAVTNTIPCQATNDDPCFDPYTRTDTVDRITVRTGARKRLSLRSTSADVYFA